MDIDSMREFYKRHLDFIPECEERDDFVYLILDEPVCLSKSSFWIYLGFLDGKSVRFLIGTTDSDLSIRIAESQEIINFFTAKNFELDRTVFIYPIQEDLSSPDDLYFLQRKVENKFKEALEMAIEHLGEESKNPERQPKILNMSTKKFKDHFNVDAPENFRQNRIVTTQHGNESKVICMSFTDSRQGQEDQLERNVCIEYEETRQGEITTDVLREIQIRFFEKLDALQQNFGDSGHHFETMFEHNEILNLLPGFTYTS